MVFFWFPSPIVFKTDQTFVLKKNENLSNNCFYPGSFLWLNYESQIQKWCLVGNDVNYFDHLKSEIICIFYFLNLPQNLLPQLFQTLLLFSFDRWTWKEPLTSISVPHLIVILFVKIKQCPLVWFFMVDFENDKIWED